MRWWTAVRVAGPVSIGLGFVLLRPTWVSVAVLGLLICVAVWLDGQERRTDDVEAATDEFQDEIGRLGERLTNERKAGDLEVLGAAAGDHGRLKARVDELAARLDAMAQQRKGPLL